MRTVLLLLLAMLAIKTSTSIALGQQACTGAYTGCLDKCVARPSKNLQDTCMEACQTQNNACFSKMFGGPNRNTATVKQEEAPPNAAPAAAASAHGEPAAALASDEQQQPKKPAAKPTKTAKPAQQRPDRQERRPF